MCRAPPSGDRGGSRASCARVVADVVVGLRCVREASCTTCSSAWSPDESESRDLLFVEDEDDEVPNDDQERSDSSRSVCGWPISGLRWCC
jgi:hypothetical protein